MGTGQVAGGPGRQLERKFLRFLPVNATQYYTCHHCNYNLQVSLVKNLFVLGMHELNIPAKVRVGVQSTSVKMDIITSQGAFLEGALVMEIGMGKLPIAKVIIKKILMTAFFC